MIYFYNNDLECLDMVREVSFSYSKKAGKEGGGKVVLLKMPPQQSFYIIIYAENEQTGKDEYITSGYITELAEVKEGVSFTFKTFEALLKNVYLPKKWCNYDGWTLPQVIADLMHGFRPIVKTSKIDLGVLNSTNKSILYSNNIAFQSIDKADLTLGWQKQEENTYYYAQKGEVIFQFELASLKRTKRLAGLIANDFTTDKIKSTIIYPKVFLRWNAQEGEKTFVRWKATWGSYPIDKNNSEDMKNLREAFEKAPYLTNRRDIKDFGKDIGAEVPYLYDPEIDVTLFLQLTFEYIKPDYIRDFNTQEIKKREGGREIKVKRTVRGFTPILHGFEILSRCSLAPFSIHPDKKHPHDYYPMDLDVFPHLEYAGEVFKGNNNFTDKGIKMDGSHVQDVLEQLQDKYKFNLTFDLKRREGKSKAICYVCAFTDDCIDRISLHGRDMRFDEKALLKSNDEVFPLRANIELKNMKKNVELPILLTVKGTGDSTEALQMIFYIDYVVNDAGTLERVVYVYGAEGLNLAELNSIGGTLLPITEETITKVQGVPYVEERIETGAKDAKTLVIEMWKHLESKKDNAKNEVFEVGVFQDVRLYDRVRLLHAESKKAYDVFIKEEKINSKNGKITKSVGLQGHIYNPFDIFFQKKKTLPVVIEPISPSHLQASSCFNTLTLEWEQEGVYDGFKISISRIDGVVEEGFECTYNGIIMFSHSLGSGDISRNCLKVRMKNWASRILFTKEKHIEITTLEKNVLYYIHISSCYQTKISRNGVSRFIKMEGSNSHIRHIFDLHEEGEDGDEAFCYEGFNAVGLPHLFSLPIGKKYRKMMERKSSSGYTLDGDCEYWDSPIFNSIEQVTNKTFSQAELGLVITNTFNDRYEGYITKPIPYQEPPMCNSWEEEFYEELLPIFGKYYVWKRGKWRERRFKVPFTPSIFFDLEKKAVCRSVQDQRHFFFCWQAYCTFVNKFQELRKKLNKMASYYNFGENIQQREYYEEDGKYNKHRGRVDEIKPFSINDPGHNNGPGLFPGEGGGGWGPGNGGTGGGWTTQPGDSGIVDSGGGSGGSSGGGSSGGSSGIPNVPGTNPKPQPNKPPKPPHINDLTLYRRQPEEEDWKEYNSLKCELYLAYKDICEVLESRVSYGDTIINIGNDNIRKDNNNKPMILDASSKANHMTFTLPGFSMLQNVYADEGFVFGAPLEKHQYFLQHAFNFYYADLDNGGADEFELKITDRGLGKIEDKKLREKYLKILYSSSSTFDINLGKKWDDVDDRIPKYEVSVLKFVNNSVGETYADCADGYRRHFTFSCWLKVNEMRGRVCIWDIGGYCVGYVEDEALHFAHKIPKATKLREVIGGKYTNAQKDYLYYDYYDFYVKSIKREKPTPPNDPLGSWGYDLRKNEYIHIMVECEILNNRTRFYSNLQLARENTIADMDITQNIYIDFKKVPLEEYVARPYQTVEQRNKHCFQHDFKNRTARDYPKYTDAEEEAKAYNEHMLLCNSPAFRIASFEPKPKMPYKYRKAGENYYHYSEAYDKTDYGWHSYDFDLAHVMLFEGALSKLERYYMREYGIYPIKKLPPIAFGGAGNNSSSPGSSNSGASNGSSSIKGNYLGIVQEKVEKDRNVIKTLKSNGQSIVANAHEFFLMAIDCKNFKAGNLYKWTGSQWQELTPFIQYPFEYTEAFQDFKELPTYLQASFYKEFATLGFALCSSVFSTMIMSDALTVLGDVSMLSLPQSDPHKKGALYERDGVVRVSKG